MPRVFKQITIAVIFVVIFSLGFLGVRDLTTDDATCFDSLQNQGEQGVDCGPVCGKLCASEILPLQVSAGQIFEVAEGDYDLLFEVKNPNSSYGARNVQYEISIGDTNGQLLTKQTGNFYVLPNQTFYLIKTALKLSGEPAAPTLAIVDTDWIHTSAEDPIVDFTVLGESFLERNGVSKYEAIVLNKSFYDFENVDINVILQNESGQVVGVSKTDIQTFESEQERGFLVSWPIIFDEPIATVQITTNTFEPTNYIRRYGSEEKFQELNPGR